MLIIALCDSQNINRTTAETAKYTHHSFSISYRC